MIEPCDTCLTGTGVGFPAWLLWPVFFFYASLIKVQYPTEQLIRISETLIWWAGEDTRTFKRTGSLPVCERR